jgi:allantoin racemase
MHIAVINPNTTASMTAKIGAAARAAAAPGVRITAAQSENGPVSIEGYVDDALAVPGLLLALSKLERLTPINTALQGDLPSDATAPAPVDAYVAACFDDTGLDACRCLTSAPVIGIGQAAFHVAALLGGRFSVVTTLSRSVQVIEHNLQRYGLASACAKVHASEVPVLALEDPASDARSRIDATIAHALAHDGCRAIVLGCAGMADLARALSAQHGVPVIDGVAAAVGLAQTLGALGVQAPRAGAYAAPNPKALTGIMAGFASVISSPSS